MTTHHTKLLRIIGIALAAVVLITVGTILAVTSDDDTAPKKPAATVKQQTPAELADTLDADAANLEADLGGPSDADYGDELLSEGGLYN